MARSFAAAFGAALRRRSLGGWLLVLALFVTGCAESCTPPTGRSAWPSLEQTAPNHASALAADGASRQQHLEQLGVPRWSAQGYRGQGIKVAILDSGFRGYRRFLGKGLPRSIRTRSFRIDRDLEARDSQHGILCAEVVHAIAPEAELLFATWEPDSPRASSKRWPGRGPRVRGSCRVRSSCPAGATAKAAAPRTQALAALLGQGHNGRDVLCFASAGNTAQRHWSGRSDPDAARWHQWSPGQTDNVLTPWGGERVAVEIYGPAHGAYELQVIDRTAGTLVGVARLGADAARRGRAIVRFEPAAGATYAVRVRGPAAAANERFHLVVLGGNLAIATRAAASPFQATAPTCTRLARSMARVGGSPTARAVPIRRGPSPISSRRCRSPASAATARSPAHPPPPRKPPAWPPCCCRACRRHHRHRSSR